MQFTKPLLFLKSRFTFIDTTYILKIKREGMLEEIEKSHISEALSSGKTPQDLFQSGISGAIEPAVLS